MLGCGACKDLNTDDLIWRKYGERKWARGLKKFD